MKKLLWPLAVLVVPAILAAAGLYLIHRPVPAPVAPSAATATLKPPVSPSPTPTVTANSPRQAARTRHRHTGPWAVVSAYYRDVNARRYAQAWALISSGLATGQTYQQFVSGYACTGAEQVTFVVGAASTRTRPCRFDLGSRFTSVVVAASGTPLWDSSSCLRGSGFRAVMLRRGAPAFLRITWDRRTSISGCPGQGTPAKPGTYTAAAFNGQIHSPATTFVLSGRGAARP